MLFVYRVAELLGKSAAEVMQFTVAELHGWAAYLEIKNGAK